MVGAGLAHAEVKVGSVDRPPAAPAHGAETLAGAHQLTGPHRGRGEVEVGDLVATVGGEHPHREARRARDPRESDGARRRGGDHLTIGGGDVDAPVLAARVGVRDVSIGSEDLTGDRPRPVARRGGDGRSDEDGEQDSGEE
ncbi:MAG: hypothetical protein WKF31_12430 [Thermoleophilaceae bacterium]